MSKPSFQALVLPCIVVLAGCSSSGLSTATPPAGDAGTGGGGDGGGGGGDAGGGGQDGGVADAPPLQPEVAQSSIGPIDVPAGAEKTVCIVKRLGNADDLVVTSVSASLTPGSHHLIVYLVSDTQENLTPTPCTPFQGIASQGAQPVLFAGKEQVTFAFPSGIAQEIPQNQMLRLEAHYINATQTDLQGQGNVTFNGLPKASSPPFQPANFIFWGTTQISIPPNAAFTAGPMFQPGIAGTHLIQVTTHQHRLGTRAQVWASAQAGDQSKQLTDDKDWSNPSWQSLSPFVDFDGTTGLSFQCDWMNTTTQTVTFGESALNEMCFIGGYYYPSQGLDLCIDGSCPNRK